MAAFLAAAVVSGAACEDEGGISYEYVAEVQCEEHCSRQIDCIGNRYWISVEECTDFCLSRDTISSNSQCTSRIFDFYRCLNSSSCDEYQTWLETHINVTQDPHVCEPEESRRLACSKDEPYGT